MIKNVPTSVWRRHWRKMLRAQVGITVDAARAWRGEAARARLQGQLAGIIALPKLLSKRKKIQVSRIVSDEYLFSILSEE